MRATIQNIFKTILIIAFITVSENSFSQKTDTVKLNLQPQLINLELDSSNYQEIFDGPPATSGMYSGLVTLLPNETVGHHNTEEYEEMLVIFSGEGQMIFSDGKIFNLKYGVIAYCPPHTEHDVKNTSSVPLKYIYIASKTK